MKNEKIRKYIDGELSGEEIINFEKEITNSPELKREIDLFKDALNQFGKLKNVNVDENYFTNILPRFRESISKQKRLKIKPSFALGSVVVLIILAAAYIIITRQSVIENEQITLQQLDNEELKIYLNNNPEDLASSQLTENIPEDYDTLFNLMVAEELSLNGYTGEYLVDVTSNEFYYNILDEFSEEELEGIYNSLIKEDFN